MTNYDKELIAKIEKYFLGIEKDISELLHDNQVTKTKLLKLDKVEDDIKRLSLEVENIKQNTLSLPAFDALVDGFLNRMDDLREVKRIVKRHESRFDVYDDKLDGINSQFEALNERVERLEKIVGQLQKDVLQLQKDVSLLQKDVEVIKTDVAKLNVTIKDGFEAVDRRFETMETQMKLILEEVRKK
jgi:chromosome segregation ATPase